MIPAHQRLDREEAAVADIDLGLEVKAKSVASTASRSINSVRERSLTASRSSRSKTTAWLRPRAFAEYIATSAQPSRSRPLTASVSEIAMPMLAVWLTSWPEMSTGWAMMSRMR